MSLGVLNNIAAIYAQNNLNNTQNSLQNTLTQLSSGSRINSGADDAAGLAVADGLHANIAALTQSAQNASDGIGLLQTADGALSQVTNLLNRAVTLSTESANGTLTSTQASTANQEYQNILTQIASIGTTTNFNSQNVFSATARTVFVSDGSAAGANVYSAIVGGLTASSVGQTVAAPVTTAAVAPITVAPVAAVANGAGVYTLTPSTSGDTLGGTFSFRVGTTGTVENLTVANGTTLAQLAAQLTANSAFTAAGLSASATSSALTITGGTSGANAAANAISFSGTSLTDSSAAVAISSIPTGTTNVPAVNSTATLTVGGGSAAGDSITGGFTLTQGSLTKTVASYTGLVSGLGAYLTSQLSGSGFSVATGGTANAPVYTFTGAANATAVAVSANTLADSTTPAATFAGASATTGTAPVAGTKSITFANTGDTFGAGSTLNFNSGTVVNVAGLTGTAAATAINNNTTLQTAGITAAYNASTKVLTFTGNATTGASFTVASGGTLTDQPVLAAVTNLVTATAATGSAATGATSTITLGSANDTINGTLALTVGTSGLPAQSLSLAVPANTTGAQLASLINQNQAFKTAGVTAAYDPTSFAVTLTGPVGAANTIVTTGTTLTDSSSSLAQAGVDFTQATISTLSGLTAQNVLTSVTTAIADVAYQRGIIGADVNELTAASGVASSESVNLTAAENSIRSTNYGTATSDLAKLKVLSETGISALAQANSVQQEVQKLLQ